MVRVVAMIILCVVGVSGSSSAEPVSVATAAPVVVATVPTAGDGKVDPGLKEISITFSKDMTTKQMWSLNLLSKDSFPKVAGKVHYRADKRTLVMPVQLQPKKAYGIWVNGGKNNNCKDAKGRPAVPYLLVFETK